MIYAAFVLKIRVLSFNKWHGLDHRNPYVMWPLEKPWEKNKRFKGILSSLKDYRHELNDEVLDIWCFQELNPIKKDARAIAKQSGYEHKICAVNRGVEVGLLHAPWTLSEGLGIFYPKSADVLNYRWELLSGKAWDFSLKYKKLSLIHI